LEKDPDARYASVADFAADVQRHLAGEPVVAVPPSALYRARKFAARHRVGVAATIAIATLLGAGLIGTSLGWRRALEQERAARDQSRRSDAIRQVLHTMLILASPQLSGPDVKLLDGLDAIVPDVRAYFREQPDLQVVVLTDIGHVYLDIGQWEKARITLEQTIAIASEKLDPWSLDRGTAENVLGLALLTLRRGAEAEPHFRLADDILGRHGLHSTADGLAVRQNLVSSLGMQGRPEEVLALLEPLAAENTRLLGPDHPDTLTTRNNIAQVERGMGRLNEAYRDAAAVLEASRRTQGRDSLAAASGAHNLAAILADLGHFAEAYALEREAVDGWKRILGARHPNVLGGLFTAAACALALDRAGDAVDLFGEIDRGSDATQVDGETECVRLLIAVASADAKTAGSSASLRDAVARASETLTPGDPDLEIARAAVVRFEHLRHAPADAVTHLRSIVDRWESPNGVHVWQLRVARRWLAEALDSQGLVAEAQVVRASLDK
ncbi:MAG: tetratricopeptide repeat protein, partial [Planctomycetes bacterium]|nr:tetratricopeptide repeat protein [Planctomycetota bacterium]